MRLLLEVSASGTSLLEEQPLRAGGLSWLGARRQLGCLAGTASQARDARIRLRDIEPRVKGELWPTATGQRPGDLRPTMRERKDRWSGGTI